MLVNMLSVTERIETGISGPLFVIVEFAPHGNLRQFLRERRPSEYQHSRQSYSGPSLSVRDFVSFAFQIARGMEYLGTRKVKYLRNQSLTILKFRRIFARAIIKRTLDIVFGYPLLQRI